MPRWLGHIPDGFYHKIGSRGAKSKNLTEDSCFLIIHCHKWLPSIVLLVPGRLTRSPLSIALGVRLWYCALAKTV